MAKQCPACQQLLDDSARFCPICGASVEQVQSLDAPIQLNEDQFPPPLIPREPTDNLTGRSQGIPPPLQVEPPPSLLKPAFLGGVALGVLSALPVVNCCCLLWLGGGGLLAVYLIRQTYNGEITPVLGAKIGFLAGMIGALFWQILELPLAYFTSPQRIQQFQRLLQDQNIPSELREFIISLLGDPLNPLALVFGIFVKAFACGLFTTIGGLLGSSFWNKPKRS